MILGIVADLGGFREGYQAGLWTREGEGGVVDDVVAAMVGTEDGLLLTKVNGALVF